MKFNMSILAALSASRLAAAVEVPVIDISSLVLSTSDSKNERAATISAIGDALENVGFMVITNHGVPSNVIESAWERTGAFFDLSEEEKAKWGGMTDKYPYGYEKGEILSAGKAAEDGDDSCGAATPDLKETFTIGPSEPATGMPPRILPSKPSGFSDAFEGYYSHMEGLAATLLSACAEALDLPSDWFEEKINHHMSALRALNYPDLDGKKPLPGQIRASAHTDYGSLTILRSGGPGLQVRPDVNGVEWTDVPNVGDGFVINIGDLMRRWTNDKWSSTLHRVVNPPDDGQNHRRQSMAFFHNINGDAVVESIETCKEKDGSSKYEPIVAKDFLLMKHYASVKNVIES